VISWHTMLPGATAFSPVAKLLALGSPQGSIRLVSATTGQELGRLEDGQGPTQSVAFSPDGKILVASDGRSARLWDVAARKVSRRLAEDAGGSQLLLFAPDGKLLLGGDTDSRLWDVAKNQVARVLPLSFKTLKSAAFSPDSRLLACGDAYGRVELWDVQSADKQRVFTGLAGYVQVLAFSPNGRTLAAGGWRGIKVWELATGAERRSFDDFEGDALSLAFTPDGRALASAVGDANILIWDIAGKALAFEPKTSDSPDILATLGKALAASDGKQAHQAIWALVGRQAKAVPYLRTLFKPAAAVDHQSIAQLIKALDNDVFAVREKASQELQKMGEAAEPALRKLLTDAAPPEAQDRARQLLEKLAVAAIAPEMLQALRAIEALEYMGTPAARELLEELAQGTSAAQVRREAAASLERLARQGKALP
jgi:hypothetical protein